MCTHRSVRSADVRIGACHQWPPDPRKIAQDTPRAQVFLSISLKLISSALLYVSTVVSNAAMYSLLRATVRCIILSQEPGTLHRPLRVSLAAHGMPAGARGLTCGIELPSEAARAGRVFAGSCHAIEYERLLLSQRADLLRQARARMYNCVSQRCSSSWQRAQKYHPRRGASSRPRGTSCAVPIRRCRRWAPRACWRRCGTPASAATCPCAGRRAGSRTTAPPRP
jgi:hypothetical protein